MRIFTLTCLLCAANFASAKKIPEIKWERIEMFGKTISIHIPEGFEQLPSGEFKKFYPKENLPKLVWGNKERSIRISFDAEPLNIEENVMSQTVGAISGGISSMYPKSKIKDEGVNRISGEDVGYVEYINKKPAKFYELIFFANFRGQLVNCVFHAPKKKHKPWKWVAHQMMESLILKKEKK